MYRHLMNLYLLTINRYATNTYVIIENSEAVVIDPAENAGAIAGFVAQKQATVKHVLVTHGHFDHIGAVSGLKKLGAKLFISSIDHSLIEFESTGGVFSVPDMRFEPDVAVNDGDVLELIGHTFRVISTPGHTPGSVCYLLDDEIIFSGDTLFNMSVGRTDFEYGDSAELSKSLEKLFAQFHDYEVLPGHGNKTTLYFERENNPYVHS